MFGRWLIRGVALALLLLCVAGWVGSYVYGVGFSRVERSYWECLCLWGGKVVAERSPALSINWADRPWGFWGRGYEREFTSSTYGSRFLGFTVFAPGNRWVIEVPFWFPTVLGALGLVWVWRKTRPRAEGRGFPVEVVTRRPEGDR